MTTEALPLTAETPAREPATLGLIVPFALGVVAASVLGRAFVPAAIGTVSWSDQLLMVDAFVAQALGALSTALLAVLLVRASLSSRAVPLRIAVSVVGGFSLLIAMTSSGGVRTPDALLFAGSIATAFLCVVVAASGERRLPELALGLAGLAGCVRLTAVDLTLEGSTLAGGAATAGFVVEVALVAAVSAFLLRARGRGAIAVAVALAFTALAAWVLIVEPDAPRWVVLRHAIESLAPRPHPIGPWLLAPVLAVFATALAVGLCIARRAGRGVVGALALVLVVRAQAEVPLLAMALSVAAIALFLSRANAPSGGAARDAAGRGISPRS